MCWRIWSKRALMAVWEKHYLAMLHLLPMLVDIGMWG